MKKNGIVVLMTAVVALVLAACGGGVQPAPTAEPTRPAAATKASEQAKPAAAPKATEEMAQPTEAPKPTTVPEPASAPEESDLSLSDRATGLDQLKSYRVSWNSTWETTKDGKTQEVTWDWLEEYTSEPQALHYIWKSSEDGVDKGGMELWQIGDTMYMLSADAQGQTNCTSFSSSDPEAGLQKGTFSPSMLGSLSGAKYVGSENVNGIATKHYKYDEKATNLAGFSKMSGDTWVASDGGYVVKDILNWQGGAGLFGTATTAGESGKGMWAWELSDPNGSFTITPPEGCESAAKGLPMMADATEKATMGDMTIYKTQSKIADVVDFYKKEMSKAGWKLEGEPQVAAEFAMLQYSMDGQNASITLSPEGEQLTVMINVTKG